MRHALALLLLLALLFPMPVAALAQGGGGAFGPLPPAQPAETPTPEPVDTNPTDDISRETLFLIGAGVLMAFVGLGMLLTRDARRSLTESDRAALERVPGVGAPRKQDRARLKQKARQKTRAQRQARKKTRRAGRG